MSIKNEAKIWSIPSGQVEPKLNFCNSFGGKGFSVGQYPVDVNLSNGANPGYTNGIRHARWYTDAPMSSFSRQGVWSRQGDGPGCNDKSRPIIDFSNFEDNSCPSFSMVPHTQQYLKSTENLLDTLNWSIAGLQQVNSVTNDVDPYNETFFRYTRTGSGYVPSPLHGALYQPIGYNANASFVWLSDLSASVFLKRGSLNTQVGIQLQTNSFTTDHNNFAIFNFETGQVTSLISPTNVQQGWLDEFNVESYNNGWYRIQMRFSNSYIVNKQRYFALYALDNDVTPAYWKARQDLGDYGSYLADVGQFFDVSKPNVTTRGKRIEQMPEQQNNWFSSSGIQPYVRNTNTSNVVFQTETRFRQVIGPTTQPPGVSYSYYFDLWVSDDTPKIFAQFYNDNIIANPFFIAGTQFEDFYLQSTKGTFNVWVNGQTPTPQGMVELPYGRNQVVFQDNGIWINGVQYDTDRSFQTGTTYFKTDKIYGSYFDMRAETRYWIKAFGVWERNLTNEEIQSL
jgi:hypothetical protein